MENYIKYTNYTCAKYRFLQSESRKGLTVALYCDTIVLLGGREPAIFCIKKIASWEAIFLS